MRLRLLVLPLALVAVGSSCSDEGDGGGLSSEAQELADAWAVGLEDDEDGFSASPEEAQCMGDAIMAELGMAPFDQAGVTADDIRSDDEEANSPGELLGAGTISEAQSRAILTAWEDDCVDLATLLGESASGDLDLDPDGQACFVDGLGDSGLAEDLLVPSFTSDEDNPDPATATAMLELIDTCSGEEGSLLVSSIAEELAADGSMTEEQAECVASAVVEALGAERLAELSTGGDFDDADPAVQGEIASALIAAAGDCGVPLDSLGG
jgi:hypothetical protein